MLVAFDGVVGGAAAARTAAARAASRAWSAWCSCSSMIAFGSSCCTCFFMDEGMPRDRSVGPASTDGLDAGTLGSLSLKMERNTAGTASKNEDGFHPRNGLVTCFGVAGSGFGSVRATPRLGMGLPMSNTQRGRCRPGSTGLVSWATLVLVGRCVCGFIRFAKKWANIDVGSAARAVCISHLYIEHSRRVMRPVGYVFRSPAPNVLGALTRVPGKR